MESDEKFQDLLKTISFKMFTQLHTSPKGIFITGYQ